MYVLSIIAGWLGAHICDALFKSQAFSHAGFTFLGGLIFGSAFFIVSFIKFNGRENVMTALNAGVMPLVLGQATGRIGCYFSGCCYGKLIAHSNLLSSFFARHPTQIYESLFLFILFAFFSLKDKLRICIADIYLYLMFYGTFRFFIEFLRGDYRGHYLYGLSPSQWLSLVIIMGMSIFLTTKSGRKLFITK